MPVSELSCPLCDERRIGHHHRDARRDYWRCARCALVFVAPHQQLPPDAEKAVYDCHRNSPLDPAYRRFLSRLFVPLRERLTPGARGLDFGCGPGPTLSVMFEEAGHPMALYDPFYAPERGVLAANYDFITATEVVEHLAAPGRELASLVATLRPGGWLGLMTKRTESCARFADWHYTQDPTHICFFSAASFEWLGRRLGMRVWMPAPDVVLMRKP